MMFKIASFLLWLMVSASAMFWILRLVGSPDTALTYAVVDTAVAVNEGSLAKLLGSTPLEPTLATSVDLESPPLPQINLSRFHLTGVVAPITPTSDQGLALIAVDGGLPKHFSVGSKIDGEWVLQSVGKRTASIGPALGAPVGVLELPLLPEPATGILESARSQ